MIHDSASTAVAVRQPGSFAYTVRGIAGTVQDRNLGGSMSRGERAELRRMRAAAVFPPEPFWTLVERFAIPPAAEPFWMDVVPHMIDRPHDPRRRPGQALAEAQLSGARLERWLRLEAEQARKEAGRILSRLDGGLNWVTFAGLLWVWTPQERRGLARDFFLSPAYRQREKILSEQETQR